MAFTEYFPADSLDSPASNDDIAHLEERLGASVPADLAAFWSTAGTFNGHLLLADGNQGPYLRILHPGTVAPAPAAGAPIVVAKGEDWDFGFVPGAAVRWVDVDREDGEILSELGTTFTEFLEALRSEHVAENDGLL